MKNHINILNQFRSKKGQIAILIDPEKSNKEKELLQLIKNAEIAEIDYFFIGGSTVTKSDFEKTISILKRNTKIPIIIFPGSSQQISDEADAILYLSLISGRNPDYLIGQHVESANELYEMDIEVIPTGYILIDGGNKSSVAYVSQTTPIPRDQTSIATKTAIAGVLQGKQIIYFDAGSGAKKNIPIEMIKSVEKLNVPIIVGGGIRKFETISEYKNSGVNVIVIGNYIENNIDFVLDLKNLNRI
ncbi:MAG: geranylgeranylglyceryl/heptaprenylglyceryl phosphate synthase [Fluviicola sp.]|nr:geranylgeranylglyceryl/heptaprenylglyceryl phosphate synthase [Fluviicola sp.]